MSILSQFDVLREQQTCAPGDEPTNDEIVATIEKSDSQFGVVVSEVGPDRFAIQFKTLPDNLDEFAQEWRSACKSDPLRRGKRTHLGSDLTTGSCVVFGHSVV